MAQRICPICKHLENEYTFFCTECGGKTELLKDVSGLNKEPTKGAVSAPAPIRPEKSNISAHNTNSTEHISEGIPSKPQDIASTKPPEAPHVNSTDAPMTSMPEASLVDTPDAPTEDTMEVSLPNMPDANTATSNDSSSSVTTKASQKTTGTTSSKFGSIQQLKMSKGLIFGLVALVSVVAIIVTVHLTKSFGRESDRAEVKIDNSTNISDSMTVGAEQKIEMQSSSNTYDYQKGGTDTLYALYDGADVMTSSQQRELDSYIRSQCWGNGINVYIVSEKTYSPSEDAKQYADDYLDFTLGWNDGIILAIFTDEREYAISTVGSHLIDYTDADIDVIEDRMLPYFRNDDYYHGFMEFATQCYNCWDSIAEMPQPETVDEGINRYELIVKDCTWTEAFYECISKGGHLVRITTDEEYQAIISQIEREGKDNIKFWLGGLCDDGNDYYWVYDDGTMGERINNNSKYDHYWLDGEPSFYDEVTDADENRMNMFYMHNLEKWIWNDVPDDVLAVADFYSGTMGYICEYE